MQENNLLLNYLDEKKTKTSHDHAAFMLKRGCIVITTWRFMVKFRKDLGTFLVCSLFQLVRCGLFPCLLATLSTVVRPCGGRIEYGTVTYLVFLARRASTFLLFGITVMSPDYQRYQQYSILKSFMPAYLH